MFSMKNDIAQVLNKKVLMLNLSTTSTSDDKN